MKLLLDTHALLWWLADDQQPGQRARELVADPGNDVLISMVSLWEIAVKTRIGKLRADIKEITDAVQ
jgi:PIN domain nuclease of toxin-antitoxin system